MNDVRVLAADETTVVRIEFLVMGTDTEEARNIVAYELRNCRLPVRGCG